MNKKIFQIFAQPCLNHCMQYFNTINFLSLVNSLAKMSRVWLWTIFGFTMCRFKRAYKKVGIHFVEQIEKSIPDSSGKNCWITFTWLAVSAALEPFLKYIEVNEMRSTVNSFSFSGSLLYSTKMAASNNCIYE